MASSPVASTGVTTQAAGASGALAGNMGGLDGLFAALMGGIGAGADVGADGFSFTVPGATDAMTQLTGGNTTLVAGDLSALTTLQAGIVQQSVQFEEDSPAITVTGAPETVKSFVEQVQALYQQLAKNGLTMGKSVDTQELAGALTKMGVDPDAAVGVAERIQTMLKLVEQQQDKVADAQDGATQGTLAAMMLAVMGQQVQAPADAANTADDGALSVQITTVEQTTVTVNVRSVFKNTDIARDMMGLSGATKKAETPGKTKKLEVALTQGTDEPGIAVTLPELDKADAAQQLLDAAKQDIPQTKQVVQNAQAAAVNGNPMTGTQVAARDVIDSPQGDTLYKLQADKNGVETLEAVKPVSSDEEILPDHVKEGAGRSDFQQMMMDTTAKTTQTDGYVAGQQAQQQTHKAEMNAFAERVTQINDMLDKAKVGQQVAVQVQPLLEQGGGTIKINLHPKDLGHITVELSVHEGKVQGSIAASEPAVVEQLARELHSLRHGLADAGLKLGDQGINLMLGNQGGQQNPGQGNRDGQQAQSGNRGGAGGFTGTGTADVVQNLAGWVSPDRVLDVNV